jgi:hypothetical protein
LAKYQCSSGRLSAFSDTSAFTTCTPGTGAQHSTAQQT